MLSIELDPDTGIAVLTPEGPLSEADFTAASGIIDPYIEEHGKLRGIMITTEGFPGWESFGSLISHVKFVRNHHQLLSRVAIVTDSNFGNLAEKIASHFVSAEIKQFPFLEPERAKAWILQ